MRILIFLLGITLLGCTGQPKHPDAPRLKITHPVALWEKPDVSSMELETLQAGTEVFDLNKVSNFLSSIYLNNKLYQEPWLRVATKSGRQGWVFAGAVQPPGIGEEERRTWQLEKRFQALFGPQLNRRWQQWVSNKNITTDSALAQNLREGLRICDSLNQVLAGLVSREPAQTLPDLSWIENASRYFSLLKIENTGVSYLALNFKTLAAFAAQTSGSQDDQFAQLGLQAYPLDSLESALPAWVFPLSLQESCSNLGAGKHLQILEGIEQALAAGNLFEPELLALKNQVLDDILGKDRTYWQPQAKILTELDEIQKANFSCLSARDQMALDARRTMIENPEANKLRLNLRAGE